MTTPYGRATTTATADPLALLNTAMEFVEGPGFSPEDVDTFPGIGPAATAWLLAQRTTNPFLQSVQHQARSGRRLSSRQLAAVANTALRSLPRPEAAAPPVATSAAPAPLPTAGYYTVAWPDGTHTTLRLRPHWQEAEAAQGIMVASYLNGPDNGSDYQGFGFLHPQRGLAVWRRFDPQNQPAQAVRLLLQQGTEGQREAGEAYATRSGRCWRCGRLLTTPESIARKIGPECAKIMGLD